jgi:hypothetical protein
LNLKSIKNKKELFKIFECPRSNTGVSYRPDKVIFVFDEFDHGIKFLYNRQVDRNRELKKLEMMTDMTYGLEVNPQEINEDKKDFNEKRYDMMMNDELCLNDLLDIFQGAVPINGVICIATTNDLESIKKLSPALVRPSRLTPIYFGYPSIDILNQISNHYFNRNLELDIMKNTILNYPTSLIIDIALKCKINPRFGFDKFQDEVLLLLNK